MKFVDLHSHTTASDGKLTPLELLQYAKEKGLSALAITDHDTIEGAIEAAKYTKEFQLEIIIGVELNTVWNQREIHMLGYFVDPDNPRLQEQLITQREMRIARSEKILARLQELGIALTVNDVLSELNFNSARDILLPHIAELMVKKGFVSSKQEAFQRYIGKGKPAYVLPTALTPIEAIKLIQESGGVAVVAHPGIYQEEGLLPDLVEAGLDGIEVYHPDHGADEREKYAKLAKSYRLIITGGSDFHGEQEGKMFHGDLGSQAQFVAEDIIDQLRTARK
ncbi:PHP domain-containing protein [Risungbinella massiliensis]|uniref:PHP domain-containing protein n=1 Tax=Risungbinella massiliensis TaxID=1329796 RepID=UPI00069A26E2|nr:PHP domain-containing protein [Risungbinella massiliensis]